MKDKTKSLCNTVAFKRLMNSMNHVKLYGPNSTSKSF